MSDFSKFPLSGFECDALKQSLRGLQEAAIEAENYAANDAIRDCLKALHEARLKAYDDHCARIRVKRHKQRLAQTH